MSNEYRFSNDRLHLLSQHGTHLATSWLEWLQNAGLDTDDALRISVHLERARLGVDDVKRLSSVVSCRRWRGI
jgi:hypothetical protein